MSGRKVSPELKQTEATLRRSQETLEQQVAQRTAKLEAINRRLTAEIAEREKAEQQWRAFLESAPDATVMIDSAGIIQFINAQTERLFGYPRKELLGQPVERLLPLRFAAVHVSHRQRFFDAPYTRPMNSGMALCGVTKAGREFPADISLSPIETAEGVLVCAAIRDDTHRQQAQQALRDAKATAEQANTIKSRFLAAASHDLRQPLQTMTVVQGVLTRLVKDTDAQTPLRRLGESIKSMDSMLNALLDINRLESGVIAPKRSDFPVARLFAQMLSDFSYPAEEKGLTLRFVPSQAVLHSDPELLQEIVRNLMANAIKYTDQGKILVGCRRRGAEVRIEVWDTGPGIPEARRQSIFQEFHQLDNPTHDNTRGLGLGLAIVERLSQLLDHRIDVQSQVGHGSMFAVTVPRGQAVAATSSNVSTVLPTACGEGETLLYIEDDPAIRDSMELLLKIEGFQVTLANDGREALAHINDHDLRPDVILTDYRLPGGETGIEVVQQLRGILGREVPTIMITGDMSNAQDDIAKQATCQLMHKPVDIEQLLDAIRQLRPA